MYLCIYIDIYCSLRRLSRLIVVRVREAVDGMRFVESLSSLIVVRVREAVDGMWFVDSLSSVSKVE